MQPCTLVYYLHLPFKSNGLSEPVRSSMAVKNQRVGNMLQRDPVPAWSLRTPPFHRLFSLHPAMPLVFRPRHPHRTHRSRTFGAWVRGRTPSRPEKRTNGCPKPPSPPPPKLRCNGRAHMAPTLGGEARCRFAAPGVRYPQK